MLNKEIYRSRVNSFFDRPTRELNEYLRNVVAPKSTAFPDAMKPKVLAFLADIGKYFQNEIASSM